MEAKMTVTGRSQDGIRFLVFSWEVDQAGLQDVFSKAEALLGNLSGIKAVFDLSNVPYINSSFIGQLSSVYGEIDENGGKMVIVGNSIINDTFDLVGFGEFVDIVSSESEAIALLK